MKNAHILYLVRMLIIKALQDNQRTIGDIQTQMFHIRDNLKRSKASTIYRDNYTQFLKIRLYHFFSSTFTAFSLLSLMTIMFTTIHPKDRHVTRFLNDIEFENYVIKSLQISRI